MQKQKTIPFSMKVGKEEFSGVLQVPEEFFEGTRLNDSFTRLLASHELEMTWGLEMNIQ